MASHANVLLVVDLGPLFLGWDGILGGAPTCMLPAAVHTDPAVEAASRTFMQQRGVLCGSCVAQCPLSRASHSR